MQRNGTSRTFILTMSEKKLREIHRLFVPNCMLAADAKVRLNFYSIIRPIIILYLKTIAAALAAIVILLKCLSRMSNILLLTADTTSTASYIMH